MSIYRLLKNYSQHALFTFKKPQGCLYTFCRIITFIRLLNGWTYENFLLFLKMCYMHVMSSEACCAFVRLKLSKPSTLSSLCLIRFRLAKIVKRYKIIPKKFLLYKSCVNWRLFSSFISIRRLFTWHEKKQFFFNIYWWHQNTP